MKDKNGFCIGFAAQRTRVIVRGMIAFIILLFMANLGAIIDAILHPEIEYFDSEHIVVGASSAFAVGILMAVIAVYIKRIEKALQDNKQAEESLLASEERYPSLFQQASDGIFYLSADGKVLAVNESFARMHGYSVEEMQGMNLQDLDTPENALAIPERMRRIMAGEAIEFETEHYHKDGHVFSLAVSTRVISVGSEQIIQAFHRDITERKHAEEQLQKSEANLRAIFANSVQSFMLIDLDRKVQSFNQVANERTVKTFGKEIRQGDSIYEMVLPRDREDFDRDFQCTLNGELVQAERSFKVDADELYYEFHYAPVRMDGEQVSGVFLSVTDATERKQPEKQLRYQSTHDALTSIYNRAFFETEMARMTLSREFPTSIIIADVDYLKATNDTLGHAMGDDLLRHTANILRSVFRESDVLARIGGDEFAVLLPSTDSASAEQMLVRVHEQLAKHNAEHPDLPPVQLSLGTATAEKNNLIEAFRLADQCMYTNKAVRKAKAGYSPVPESGAIKPVQS